MVANARLCRVDLTRVTRTQYCCLRTMLGATRYTPAQVGSLEAQHAMRTMIQMRNPHRTTLSSANVNLVSAARDVK